MFEKTFLEKMRAPVTQTGLRIYKNNIHSARMAALDDIFPAVKAFAGEEFFKQACFFYAADNDGVVSNLNLYGKNFGSYLSALPQCHPYPYLRDIADFEYDIRRIFYFRDQ
ncbi:MAG: putative DNA-binding domain-containing protein, partial [Pseudomonadota bacterium]